MSLSLFVPEKNVFQCPLMQNRCFSSHYVTIPISLRIYRIYFVQLQKDGGHLDLVRDPGPIQIGSVVFPW